VPDADVAAAQPPAEPVPDAEVAPAEPASAPVADGVEVPAGSEFARPLPEVEPVLPQASVAPSRAVAPVVLQPGEGRSLPATDTSPAAPAPGLASPEAPASPMETAAAPAVAPQPGSVAAQTASPAPAAPEGEVAPDAADLPPPPPLTPEEQAMANPSPDEPLETGSGADVSLLPLDPPMTDAPPQTATAPTGLNPRPSAGFTGQVDGVRTDRLPRIGDAPGEAAPEVVDPSTLPPIELYARAFANPDGKPAFAVVLIDRGAPDLQREMLAALPFPVTFALDPTLPNVDALAAVYLAAGQEVVMLATAIPDGATASDLEVTFGAHDAALPQAVAVLDLGDDAGFQGNRPIATQIVPIVKAQGRGLLTYDAGLNAADQVASREGLRAATIFRRIDAEGEPATAIRRVLDRAVFKAAQDGRVAVIGEASDATMAALLEWTIEGRASAVALAPVTAVLVAR
jgi:uncharacterized protein